MQIYIFKFYQHEPSLYLYKHYTRYRMKKKKGLIYTGLAESLLYTSYSFSFNKLHNLSTIILKT